MIDFILARLRENDVLSGLVGGSLFATLLYLLRSLPGLLWELATWRFTCSITVCNEDDAFERISEWLSSLTYTRTCRNLRLSSRNNVEATAERAYLSPGLGKHLVWFRGRPLVVERTMPKEGAPIAGRRAEDIRISKLGASSDLLHDLVREISDERNRARAKTVDVYLYRHYWRLVCRKPKRALEMVILPAAQKAAIIEDAERFTASRDWYSKRGVPFRRGYLFEGPAGTGKTTLALALAGHLGRPIYALNLGSIRGDDALIDAVCDVPEHGILLIEDIDAAELGKRVARPKEGVAPGQPVEAEEPRVTLSGLLNVLDGVFSRDGRILIMTTNHPERIDPALLRPGRADRQEHIGELDRVEVIEMCRRFGAEYVAEEVTLPIAPAALQERLLRERATERIAAE